MTGVRMELTGAEEAMEVVGRVAERAANPRGMFDLIGLALVTSTQMRFERGEGPDGTPWPPSIRAIAEGGKTLIDLARLMQSITHEAWDSGVAVGTNVIYGAVHQLGAVIRPVWARALFFRIGDRLVQSQEVTIPARPFLGIDVDDEVEIRAIAAEWLIGEEGAGDAA